jgi:hypothetical protein
MAGQSSSTASSARELHYQLPEPAYKRLCNTRDEIRFLAELTARLDAHPDPLRLSPHMLFLCFDRFDEALTGVVRASVPPTPGEGGAHG